MNMVVLAIGWSVEEVSYLNSHHREGQRSVGVIESKVF